MAKKNTNSSPQKGIRSKSGQGGAQGRNYLLAIAIDAYRHCTPLNNAVLDVETFVALMKKRYQFEEENVLLIKNEEATKRRIEQAFIQMTRKVGEQDNLIVYFSGHGRYDSALGGHWVPVEAGRGDDDWPDYLSNGLIKVYLNRIRSFHTFLIADSCFSGTLFIDKSKEKFTGDRRETEPSRWGLTSGKKEIVSDGPPGKHSPFAAALLDVLSKAEKPPNVMYICDLVLEKVAANAQQTPMGSPLAIRGHQGGQFVFHFRADEKADWAELRQTPEGLQHYLALYPQGAYRREADRLLANLMEEKAWQKALAAKSISLIINFEEQFPDSRRVSSGEVDRCIAELEEEELWQEALRFNSISAYRDYLRRSRLGKYRREADEAIRKIIRDKKEPDAWRRTQSQAGKAAYEAYLKEFPEGARAAEARTALSAIRLEEERQEKEKKAAEEREAKGREQEKRAAAEAKRKRKTKAESRQRRRAQQAAIAQKMRSRWFWGSGLAAVSLVLVVLSLRQCGLLPPDDPKPLPMLEAFIDDDGKYGYRYGSDSVHIAAQYDFAGAFLAGKAEVVLNGDTISIDEKGDCIANCLEDRDRAAWAEAIRLDNIEVYQAYEKDFPEGIFSEEARQKITEKEAVLQKDEAVNLPAAVQKLANDMQRIQGGTFTMGSDDSDAYSDECPHSVSVSSFSLNKYEVTQVQWRAVMGENPSYNKGCDECPVENVSWNDVQDFLKKLHTLTGQKFRLPTEAEWEFAAKGGTKSKNYKYAGGNDIDALAWYNENARNGNTNGAQKTTRPVGGKLPNELGLYDMSGNVWEWCQDTYRPYPNCSGEASASRVLRGGSWLDLAWDSRSSRRFGNVASRRDTDVGLRLAQD